MSIKIGLIGLGYWGPNVLRNLFTLPHVKVVACSDLDKTRLEQIKHTHPDIFLTTQYEKLLAQDIDAIVIVTPPSTHYAIASTFLKKKKHVLVEKPMTTSYREAVKLVTLAQKMGVILMVDHIFVYSSPVRKLKELIDKKMLGELYYFDSTRVNLGLFQKDTNVLWDLACHDFSIVDYLVPFPPVAISCVGKIHTKNGQIDLAYVTIRYQNNFLSHIHVNWLAPTKTRRIVIGGSKKMVVYDEGNVEERIKIYDRGVSMDEYARQKILVNYRIGQVIAPFIPAHEALNTMCRHFIQSIQSKRQPFTDGVAGSRVVKLLELAEKSSELKKEVRIYASKQ